MTIIVKWLDAEQTILLWEYHAGWTWQGFDDAVNTLRERLRGVTHNIARIINWQQPAAPPEDNIWPHWEKAASSSQQNTVQTIIVDASPFITALNRYFSKTLHGLTGRFIFVDTMEEARKLAEQPPE